ncbi:MAG: right-handed parallel beta-helix repeat-containing protein [Ignavibacteriales bacterium]|nr:right-handed parallel beta-helix repeat-containing protein [Ignavibacteriales bacterium]
MFKRYVVMTVMFFLLLPAQPKKTIDRFDIQEIGGNVHVVRSMNGKYASLNEFPKHVRDEITRSSARYSSLKAGSNSQSVAMVTFVVSNAGDDPDSDIDDGLYSPPTLRSAIENANKLGGAHAISFASGITVISPATQLPSVNVALTIDGTVAAGKVILDGSASLGTYGLTLGKTSTVKNMIFKSWWSVGLGLGFGSDNSIVQKCEFILNKTGLNINGHGVTVGGDDPANGNNSYNNTQDGIAIVFANDNIIKNNFSGTKDGLTASPNTYAGLYVLGERNQVMLNVFSGNDDSGLEIGEFSINTLVDDNFIGMDASGIGRLPNKGDGITTFADKDSIVNNIISGNASGITVLGQASQTYIGNNTIGSNITFDSLIGNRYGGLQVLGEGVVIDNNVISNNKGSGILLTGNGGATVRRNYIGTNQNGTLDCGNTGPGINIVCDNNIIGGPSNGDMNIISGNGGSGIEMFGGTTFSFPGGSTPNYVRGNVIRKNYIGTNYTGSARLPNSTGISMQGYIDSNFVRDNLISGNQHHGVWLKAFGGVPTRNVFVNNYIGTMIDAKNPLSNDDRGVYIQAGSDNLFGGPTFDDKNLISGNFGPGVWISGNASGNKIKNNVIGTDLTGYFWLPNSGDGVLIDQSASNNVIERNLISCNGRNGVTVETNSGFTPNGNIIIANNIGLDIAQAVAFPNYDNGILINKATNTRIGGSDFDSSNVISGNTNNGIYIFGDTSRGNLVRGNYIGTDDNGDKVFPNYRGVLVARSNRNSIGGSDPGSGNLISGNLHEGVYLYLADSNTVERNIIGLDLLETKPLPNQNSGVALDSANYNVIGGDQVVTGNTISGNKFSGIAIVQSATGNKIYNNVIGTDFTTKTKKFGNEVDGIQILGGANRTWIGKTGAGNVIRFNALAGIYIGDSTQNKISENSIFGNGNLGIDLVGEFTGVTPNDDLDVDKGGNDMQNFPTLFFADGPFPLRVAGTMESKPNETYTIEFFSTDVKDSTGYGEGKTFITVETVGTDSTGFGYFNFIIPTSVSSGLFITATAIDFDGNTSEFSKCVEVKASDVYADIAVTVKAQADTVKKGDTVAYVITLHNNGPDSATQVVLRDTLSKRLTYIADSTSKGNSTFVNGVLTVTVGLLEPGEKVNILLVATADSIGATSNKAFASAFQSDFDPSNNADTDTVVVPAPLSVGNNNAIPQSYALYQNYPNPFNPTTEIRYQIPEVSHVTLKVYDIIGREVATLINETKEAGRYTMTFDGSKLSSGMYIYSLKAGSYNATKKLLLVK